MNIKLLKLFKTNINEKEGYLNCYLKKLLLLKYHLSKYKA